MGNDQELEVGDEVRTTNCLFCGTTVRYLADLRPLGKKKPKTS